MIITPHILSITAPVDPNRNNFRITVTNSASVEVVNELVPGNVTTVDIAPAMAGQPSGDYNANIASVGPGGESDPIPAGLFGFFPVPLPVTSASIT